MWFLLCVTFHCCVTPSLSYRWIHTKHARPVCATHVDFIRPQVLVSLCAVMRFFFFSVGVCRVSLLVFLYFLSTTAANALLPTVCSECAENPTLSQPWHCTEIQLKNAKRQTNKSNKCISRAGPGLCNMNHEFTVFKSSNFYLPPFGSI